MRVYHLGTPHQAQTGCGEGRDARQLQSNPRPCGLERQTAVHSSPPGLGEHPRHLGWDNLQGITSPDIGLRSSLRANGLPRWFRGKESACHAGDMGPIPGSGRPPGGGNGHPLQYSCLEDPMGKGAWGLLSMAKSRTLSD